MPQYLPLILLTITILFIMLTNQLWTLLTSIVKKLNSKHLLVLFVVLTIAFLIFLVTGCGTTKAVVKHARDNSTTTISVSTSNPTSVEVSPNLTISLDSLRTSRRRSSKR